MFFGAVQLGIMAAGVVLFVPMGMAGWHLSRNKVLFFSGALFISLAICIHLIPYFPSFFPTDLDLNLIPNPQQDSINSCFSLLNHVSFHPNSNGFSWNFENDSNSRSLVTDCDFQKLGRVDVSDLLNGSWVVVAGDSQARLFMVSLLDLVLGSEKMDLIHEDLFKRHSDYHIVVEEIGLKLDFIWLPYGNNLTDVVNEFKRNHTYPDVLVIGSGLWHMLHYTNYTDYGVSLRLLKDSLDHLLPVFNTNRNDMETDSSRALHLFWLGMPSLTNGLLNTEEKRMKMTREMCDAYDDELSKSKILREDGGSFLLLDVETLSSKCGVDCSLDGMHYNDVVYEACVHVMLNALLIESHQKL